LRAVCPRAETGSRCAADTSDAMPALPPQR